MSATEPIRNRQSVLAMESYYLARGELRNHALVVMGVYTALRISDLLRLRWDDVYDFEQRRVLESICLSESKTGKTKNVALHKKVRGALSLLAARKTPPLAGAAVFASRRAGRAISRVQAYRIVRAASDALRIGRVSCHSLRKTFGYHAWKSGVSPAVIMEIYNHSDFDVTRRYLGVTRDDTDAVYLDFKIK